MDTRFPPTPTRIRVPLYPQKTRFIPTLSRHAEETLLYHLSSTIDCRPEQLLIASSASAALYAWLSEKGSNTTNLKVAVPAYSCQSIVEAIIEAGAIPVFVDIGIDMNVSTRSIRYSINQGCTVFLWPNYLGSRIRPLNQIKLLREQGIIIIFDEAQSFPVLSGDAKYDSFNQADYVLLSFGLSKSLAGVGGGALMATKPSQSITHAKATINNMPIPRLDNTQQLKAAFLYRLQLYSPKIAEKIYTVPKPYARLDQLMEDRPYVFDKRIRISPSEAATTLQRLRTYPHKIAVHQKYYEQIKDAIQSSLGVDALKPLRHIHGIPAILGVSVNNENRYELFGLFARYGVQTTWYYYPLNMVKRYKMYASEPTEQTNIVAASIVILPFQWGHSKKQRLRLLKVIKNVNAGDKSL